MSNSRETRITVDTTTANPSIVLLNTSYLYRNKYGILKSIIFCLTLVTFVLVLWFKHKTENRYFYLLLISFSHLYIITLMIICSIISLTTATLLTKISLDFVFHFMAFVLYLIAGIWILVSEISDEPLVVKIFCSLALIVSFFHLAHGVLSYKGHIS